MECVTKLLCYIFLITMGTQEISGNPFLYNSGQSIISSIFSSSGATDSNPNIEDLRIEKPVKHESQRLNTEEAEFDARTENEEEMKNEASPGIIQKKIGKILAKLQLFSTLRNSLTPATKPEEENVSDDFFESDEDTEMKTETIAQSNDTNILRINDSDSPPLVSANPARRIDAGNRFSLLSSQKDENGMDDDKIDDAKLELTPGLGVYFMELLGGLAGLIYGAAIQVANIGNGSTTPNPNSL